MTTRALKAPRPKTVIIKPRHDDMGTFRTQVFKNEGNSLFAGQYLEYLPKFTKKETYFILTDMKICHDVLK